MLTLVFVFCAVGTLACSEEVSGPRAWIDFPLDQSTVPVGAPVSILSHAYARDGIAEVLLSVNGEAYRRNPPATPGESFSKVAHEWLPQQEGDYLLQVKTFSKNGETSNPVTVRVRAIGKGTPTPVRPVTLVVTPVRPVTLVVTPVPISVTPVTPSALSDLAIVSVEALFVGYKGSTPICNTQVTYRNAGTAAVPRDFTIQFHFNGVPTLANTVAGGLAPGASDQITFVYQFEGSPYIGINLDSTNVITESSETNNAFAEARACRGGPVAWYTDTPTPPPTRTPTIGIPLPPPPSGCSGTPNIASFSASPSSITAGNSTTLSWGAVTNADSVTIEPGIGGVSTPGSRVVAPGTTTTYTLTARCGSNTQTRQTTVTVLPIIQIVTPTITPTRTRTPTPVDTTPPPIPNPQDPTGGESVSCSGATGTATLKWSSVSDPSGVTYYVKWNRAGQPASGWDGTGTQHSISISCGYQYSWQVRACDGAGNCSNWSSSATFMAGTIH